MITVQIAPHKAFANGELMTAEKLNVTSVSDNLVDEVTFKYQLQTIDGKFAGESTYKLSGERYKEWDASARGAFEIVAKGIGVEIVNVSSTFGG